LQNHRINTGISGETDGPISRERADNVGGLTSHGAGQHRPVNSGKLLVWSNVTNASFQFFYKTSTTQTNIRTYALNNHNQQLTYLQPEHTHTHDDVTDRQTNRRLCNWRIKMCGKTKSR